MDDNEKQILAWLLEGDPAIRWQALRDLAGAPASEFEAERLLVSEEGWGARLLEAQDADGRWAGELYIRKWVSTTYTLQLLRLLGLAPAHPRARLACRLLLDGGFRGDGSVCYGKTVSQADHGVTGMVLALGAYFLPADGRVHAMADFLCGVQRADGGWDPEEGYRNFQYSFDATLLILDGLREYAENCPGQAGAALEAGARGREFLLQHRLFKYEGQEEVIHPAWTVFPFPPRWHYDVLTALDYFRACGAERDPRLEDAVALVRSRRGKDGRWNLPRPYPGRTFFEMEETGKPSRWNTLRALRVLRWWESI